MLAAEDQQTPAAAAAAASASAAASTAAAAAETPPHETPQRGRSVRHEPATSTPPLVTAPCLSRPLSAAPLPAASPSLRSPLLLTPRSPPSDASHSHPTLEWMNPLPTSPLLRETAGSMPGSEAAWSCRSPSEVAGSVASTDVEDFASADEIDEADELPEPLPSRRRRASPALMAAMHGAAEDHEPAHDDDLR